MPSAPERTRSDASRSYRFTLIYSSSTSGARLAVWRAPRFLPWPLGEDLKRYSLVICGSLVVSNFLNLRFRKSFPYEPRFRRHEDWLGRQETRYYPQRRWNSTPYTPCRGIKVSSSSALECGTVTRTFTVATRPQLTCRNNLLGFQGGKTRAGSCFVIGP